MQLNPRAPGLYLHATEPEPDPVNPTGITGLVGLSEKGPVNTPQPLRNWLEYTQVFGDFVDYGFLAESVFGFFLNGGEKCWVVRVADTRDRSAENVANRCPAVDLLQRASNTGVIVDGNGDETIRMESIDQGSWGNDVRFFVTGSSGRDTELAHLTKAAGALDAQVVVDSGFDLPAGAAIVISDLNDAGIRQPAQVLSFDPLTSTLKLTAPVGSPFPPGSKISGKGFRIEIVFRGLREAFDNLSITPGHPRYFADVINGDSAVVDYVEKQARGNSVLVRVEHVLSPAGLSRFKPVSLPNLASTPKERVEGMALRGGGDGFTYARAAFRDAANLQLFSVRAKKNRGRSGNGIRIASSAFHTKTALRTPGDSGSSQIVMAESVAGFAPGDSVIIDDPVAAITETKPLLQVDPGNKLVLSSNLANSYPIGADVRVADRFNLHVFRPGNEDPVEEFFNLSGNPASPRFYRTLVNANSSLICVDVPDNPFVTLTPGALHPEVILTGGSDPGEMDYRYYTGYEKDGSFFAPPEAQAADLLGLSAFEGTTEVSLLAMPDLAHLFRPDREGPAQTQSLIDAQRDLLRHCFKLGERFALLDPPQNSTVSAVAFWPEHFPEEQLRRFGALYYPWVFATFDAHDRPVPPSGLVAGVTANSDILNGVHKAPANAVIKSAFDIGLVVDGTFQGIAVDRETQDELNPEAVNCLRKFDGGAIRINGARTLSSGLPSRYVNIRRTLLSVVKELSVNMLWTVFEPNDPSLWTRVETSLTRFFQSLLAKGVTASDRADEAFFVKCDSETNPPDQVNAGQMVAEIGIALLAPAEFIILTAKRTPGNLRVIEEET